MEKPEQFIPVIKEELVTGTREVKTGTIRVNKKVEHVRKIVEMDAIRDVARITRVAINKPVDSIPATREEGDTLIVPIVEEQLIVRKQLVLKEEIHIRRGRTKGRISKAVTLDHEHATVERLDADGNVIARSRKRD